MRAIAHSNAIQNGKTMLEFDFFELSALGLTPALASRACASDTNADARLQLVRVTSVHRETTCVHDGRAERTARLLPRLAKALTGDGDALVVGDWTLADVEPNGDVWIVQRIEPASQVMRRDADGRHHGVASNVDTALLVMGLDGDFNASRTERYLALVHAGGVTPVIVLTKIDLVPHDEAQANIAMLRERIPRDVDIVSVNATDASAAHALRDCLTRGQTLVLLGSSGAGKSTLVNTLLGETVQATRATRAHDGRGMHTTTSRSLHRLPGGACVIDTPGLRTLRPEIDEEALSESFADVDALAVQCRFRDCRHLHEPGCAVRAGVDPLRLRNYQKLLREISRDTQTALDRQRQVADWKARGRLARERMRMKGRDG